jgi:ATP-dependent helicase Lhr and Lhr-like helicase
LVEHIFKNPDLGKEDSEESTLTELFLQWLSFYGPVRKTFIKNFWGFSESFFDEMLAGPAEVQDVVFDHLTEGARELEICDRENLEILLRMARRARQPSIKALGIDHLPLFLGAYQGLTEPGDSAEDLKRVLDQLFGFPAQAEAWEKHILPARLVPYYDSWLDSLNQSSDLLWFGCGKGKISFAFSDDLELFIDRDDHGCGLKEETNGKAIADELKALFPRRFGKYSLVDIVQFSKSDSRVLTKKLWNLTWRGLISNDAFATLRRGILTKFSPLLLNRERDRPGRSAFNRWSTTRPMTGNWYVLDLEAVERDPVEEAELVKDRVRQLFRRYGILFRELLANELPLLQWGRIFKALRVMELSGEIFSGYFFEGIPGLQFISAEAFRFWSQPLPEDSIFWINAADPASLCGLKLEALKGVLPSRIASTYLVYRGFRLVVISRRNGAFLEFMVPPDEPHFPEYLSFFKVLLGREFNPEKYILVEKINGKPALESPYAGPLQAFGFNRSYKGLELVRRYG